MDLARSPLRLSYGHTSKLKEDADSRTEVEPQPDQIAALATEVYHTDMIPVVIQNLYRLDFDVRFLGPSLFLISRHELVGGVVCVR